MAGRGDQVARSRGRLRLVVIQALVFSLFATLFVRLYYLQVIGGESYQAQAANQSVRDIVVQPQRGLIVDDQGRPLVANRTSWVISIDRTLLGKLSEDERTELLQVIGVSVVFDVLLTPFVLPPVMAMFRRLEHPDRALA